MAVKCPSCGHENIPGEDRCVECFHSLMHVDLPKPKSNDAFQQIMMNAPISDLITGEDLLVADPEDSIDKIVSLLQREKKNCVLVYKKKHLLGILSHRDIIKKVASAPDKLTSMKVESVMTPNPEYVKSDDPIAFAVNKMALGGFRHVPVLAPDGTPVTILAIKDVLEYLALAKAS